MRSAQEIVDMLRICNARRANDLLNVSPDRSGKIPEDQLQCLREIGDLLRAQKGK